MKRATQAANTDELTTPRGNAHEVNTQEYNQGQVRRFRAITETGDKTKHMRRVFMTMIPPTAGYISTMKVTSGISEDSYIQAI